MADETLGERRAAILRSIVAEFIATGEPVGSKHLVERSGLGVSPATVRNEMARLEEMGYLAQPHTSAGRVPTDLAYRFVVDQMRPRQLAAGQRRALDDELDMDESTSIDDLLHRATDVVSRFTHQASAILAQRLRPGKVRRIEILPLAEHMAMTVLIADNGRVEQRMIPLDRSIDADVLGTLADKLSAELGGLDLEDGIGLLRARATTPGTEEDRVIDGVAAGLDALRESEDHVAVGGVGNLAGAPELQRDTLQRLYESIERQTELLELLASALDANPVSVRIGRELERSGLEDVSLVVANFGSGTGSRGSVGVIGPIRMDYGRVIATANAVARALEGRLGAAE